MLVYFLLDVMKIRFYLSSFGISTKFLIFLLTHFSFSPEKFSTLESHAYILVNRYETSVNPKILRNAEDVHNFLILDK